MNIERIIQMATRMFMRKVMNKGINASVDYAARRGKDKAEMSEEERQQAQDAKQMAQKARKSARLLRRLGKF